MEVNQIKETIRYTLNKNKANNIVVIDLQKKSYIADYMIIASGTSSRHLQSLSENIITELKKIGLDNCRIEGYESNDWKLVDAIDIIVHLFHPDKRSFYDIEKMWSEDLPKKKH
jgi:iojap-like ribosome-associated protein